MSTDRVLIIGGGPAGMVAAVGLARADIPVTVIEAEPGVVPSPRAIVYHWSVLEGLDRLGLFEDADALGFRKVDYEYRQFDTGERAAWSLDVLGRVTRFPFNVHLGQHRLVEIATAHLSRYPHAEVVWSTRVESLAQDDHGVVVDASTAAGPVRRRGSWCIAADGARSTIRRALGVSFDGMTWPGRFVATNVRYPFDERGFAQTTLFSDPVHGAIIAKIDSDGLWRCTFQEAADLPPGQTETRVDAYFREILGDAEAREVVVDAVRPYTLHQRVAERLRVGRVMLIGDAAHATNPTGGLGLTSGLFDAYALAPTLAGVIRDGNPDRALDRWAEDRHSRFVALASPQAIEMKRLVYDEADPARRRRDLENLRRSSADEGALLARLQFTQRLESPPVTTAG
jgi:3-(3-hydroxy-phenyl)propionate hydroxylase